MICPDGVYPAGGVSGADQPDRSVSSSREACKRWQIPETIWGHPDYEAANVNLSVVQLLQNDIVEQVRCGHQARRGSYPENLTLEVTEGLAINDMSRMKKILAEISRNLACVWRWMISATR